MRTSASTASSKCSQAFCSANGTLEPLSWRYVHTGSPSVCAWTLSLLDPCWRRTDTAGCVALFLHSLLHLHPCPEPATCPVCSPDTGWSSQARRRGIPVPASVVLWLCAPCSLSGGGFVLVSHVPTLIPARCGVSAAPFLFRASPYLCCYSLPFIGLGDSHSIVHLAPLTL